MQSHRTSQVPSTDVPVADIAVYHNLFVACLPRQFTNRHLAQLFAPYNPISTTVMMDIHTGKSKGFGFVLLNRAEDGLAALTQFHGRVNTALGHTFSLHVSPSKFDGFVANAENNRVFVRNVPMVFSSEHLHSIFSQFGEVQSVEVRQDESLPFNLVALTYSNAADARYMIDNCHGEVLFPEFSPTPIMAKFADNNKDGGARKSRRHQLSADDDHSHKAIAPAASSQVEMADHHSYHHHGAAASTSVYRQAADSSFHYHDRSMMSSSHPTSMSTSSGSGASSDARCCCTCGGRMSSSRGGMTPSPLATSSSSTASSNGDVTSRPETPIASAMAAAVQYRHDPYSSMGYCIVSAH